ncbi:MAG: undecaprenyl-diphosphate phosphatase [Microgenomates group bacterium]
MSFIQALILAVVQGITEFLPISSTGHINLLQHFFGLSPSLTFDIFLNTASLLAVIFYFRQKVPYFFKNFKYIFVGTIPALVAGLFFKDQIEVMFSSVQTLPYEFLFTAILLLSSKYFKHQSQSITYKKSLVIGMFQALAIIPAISRSGSTIFAALLLGLAPIDAFNFSFALLIPASIGALLLDIKELSNLTIFGSQNLIAFFVCFFISLASLHYLQKIMVNRSLWKFGYYCLFLGMTLLFVL